MTLAHQPSNFAWYTTPTFTKSRRIPLLITAPEGKGTIFAGVCHSVHVGGRVYSSMHLGRGCVCPSMHLGRGVCIQEANTWEGECIPACTWAGVCIPACIWAMCVWMGDLQGCVDSRECGQGDVWMGMWADPPSGYYGIQSISGWYASYWNGFFFCKKLYASTYINSEKVLAGYVSITIQSPKKPQWKFRKNIIRFLHHHSCNYASFILM